MPLIDRGVDMIDMDQLRDEMSGRLAAMEMIPSIFFIVLFYAVYKFDLFTQYPSNLYKFIMFLDWVYAVSIGPFRWLVPDTYFYENGAFPTTNGGCKFAVFLDTFCQIGLLYTNTYLVASVFYMVYFGKEITAEHGSRLTRHFTFFFVIIVGLVSGVTVAGEVHNYVGWCTADSVNVIFKQLIWFLSVVIQVTLIIPTNLIIFERYGVEKDIARKANENVKNKEDKIKAVSVIGNAFYARYLGIIFSQMIGLFPIMAVEFLGLARKMVPSFLMWCVLVAFPLSHILDLVWLSLLAWPKVASLVRDHYDDVLRENGINMDTLPCISILLENDDEVEVMLNTKVLQKPRKKSCFDQVPFWLHLLCTLLVPFALLLALCLWRIDGKLTIINRANLIKEDIVLTTLVSNYIHETQKERGATGVFMTSNGQRFQCEILAQYTTTDVQKALLQTFLNTEFANVKLVTKLTFLHALIRMMGIDDNRDNVQHFRILKGDALGWYTTQNMYFVGIVAQVCRDSHLHDNSIIHLIYSNLAFVSAKEKAGVERAKGSVAFGDAQDHKILGFTAWKNINNYRVFVDLVAGQDTHLFFFETYVSVKNLNMYINSLEDASTKACDVMRAVALDANATLMAEIDSGTWFDNMTSKINLIRGVEAKLAEQLTQESELLVSSTTEGMVLVVCLLVLVLIIDGLMVLGLIRTNENLKTAGIGQKGTRSYRREDVCCWQTYVMVKNMSFVAQVLVPVLLCGVGLVIIAWMLLQEQVAEAQLAASTWENMNLSFFMSNYIHETQKERGATGVFVSSDGKKFRNKLGRQRDLCDVHRASLFAFMTQEYIDYGGLLDESAVLTWVAMSNVLPDHRRNVTMLTVITDGQALAHYTIMNKWIVKTVGIMALRGSEGSIEAGLLAYLGFMYMKEKAGNERAVGTLGFGAGMWADIKSWQKFITLVAIQGNAYLYFEQFGSEESIALHAKNEDSKVSRVVLTWRNYALENKTQESTKSKELSMFNVAAADWFDNTTFRINLFRNVETMIADELNTFFDEIDTSTQDFVFGILLTLVFLTLLTLYVGIKGIRLLLRSQAMGNYSGMGKKKRRRRRKKKVEGK